MSKLTAVATAMTVAMGGSMGFVCSNHAHMTVKPQPLAWTQSWGLFQTSAWAVRCAHGGNAAGPLTCIFGAAHISRRSLEPEP